VLVTGKGSWGSEGSGEDGFDARFAQGVQGPRAVGMSADVGRGLVGDEAVRRAERGYLAERADAELGRVRDGDRAGGLPESGLLDRSVVQCVS
jgi:hypothetical protein